MLPSRFQYCRGFVLRTLVFAALIASLFAVGCNFGGKGGGGGGNGAGGGNGGGGGPVYTATVTHQGNFTQGQQNATYTVTLTNIGGNFVSVNGNGFGGAFVMEELPSGLTLVSMAGVGWTCSIAPPPPNLPGCNLNNPIAAGASALPVTVTVNVAPNASSPQVNQVGYPGPACATGCPTVSDTTTILPATAGPAMVSTVEPFPIFAGGPQTPFTITVTNDVPGDVLTTSLTMDANTGFNCTTATCGTIGAITGTPGSGSYSVLYTPPLSTTGFTQTFPTIMVSSNQVGSIAANDSFEVDPAGILVTTDDNNGFNEGSGTNVSNNTVQVGSAAKTVIVKVYNDGTGAGVTFPPLTGSGYACANIGTNTCGTLGAPTPPVLTGTTTTTTITYTPPASSLPSAPYDKPRIQAVSKANPTRSGSIAFVLNSNLVTNLKFNFRTKFNSVLTGAAPTVQTVVARLVNDTGSSKTVNWTLTASGAPCQPACGMLGTPTVTAGVNVRSAITYTPPSSVPTVTADQRPTITATSVDDPTQTDSFTFTITDGTCGTGNEKVLNGQYAFLLRGGVASAGYAAFIGSFTADGAGKVMGGLLDINRSSDSFLGLTILPTGTSTPPFDSIYSVGSDNRGCLTLTDSGGGFETFRFSVGTLVNNIATQGRIIRFDDNNWRGRAQSGVLMKQDPTSFNPGAFSGTYADGFVGVDSNGNRFASAGLVTSDGVSALSSISTDFDDGGTTGNLTGGSGSYTIATNAPSSGRGTTIVTIPGAGTNNLVLYMVSPSEIIGMTTDSVTSGRPLESGELKRQTGPFSTTALNGNGYVFYTSGVNPSNGGGNVTAVGQATFTTNGNATVTIDENNNATSKPEQTGSAIFTVAPNGRMTVTGLGSTPPVIYLIDSNSGFSVGTDNGVPFGFVEKQTGGPFSTASFTGPFFFGGDAPTTGPSSYDSGTVIFDGLGGITGNGDGSGPNGLKKDVIGGSNGTYSFSASSIPQGQGSISTEQRAYAISSSKIVMMRWVNSTVLKDPELYIIQK